MDPSRVKLAPRSDRFARLRGGATSEDTCEYYEKGLVAPGVNYDAVPPYLREAPGPIDANGYVTIPTKPGLGYDIIWEYIEEHRVQGGA